jgi:YD repeat-containing protein
LHVERLEDRCVPAAISWVNAGGGDWDTASNWNLNRLPVAGDQVTISQAGITVTHSVADTDAMTSLSCNASLSISAGSLTVTAGTTIGSSTTSADLTISGGTLSLGNSTVNGNLVVTGGTLSGAGTVNVFGQTIWTGGTMSGSGTTSARGGLQLGTADESDGNEILDARTLTNRGSAVWAGGSFTQADASTVNNASHASFDIQDDLTWYSDSASTFANAGKLTKSAGSSSATIEATFDNTGMIDVESGTLDLAGGGSAAGNVFLNSATALQYGGNFTANSEPDSSVSQGQTDYHVADFTAPAPLSTYAASIDWGDGSGPTAGTIVQNDDGSFSVYGSHDYATAGDYDVTTTVTGLAEALVVFDPGVHDDGPYATTTSVSSSVNPSVYGQSVTFTGTVGHSSGTATPTGTLTFKDGSTTLGTRTLSNGSATFSISSLAVGSHSITVSYGGDSNYNASTSGTLTQTVNKDATTTSVTSSVNPSVYDQSVTFTATVGVSAPGAGTPSGTVSFLDGSTTLGTASLSSGSASFSTSTLAVGTHSITVSYAGDGNDLSSTSSALSQVVNKASTGTTVVSSVNPSTYCQNVTFTATVSAVSPGGGTPSGTVTFLDGSTTLGTQTLSGGTASFSTSALSIGSHSITVSYGGDGNFTTSTSTALSQTVQQAAPQSVIYVNDNWTSTTDGSDADGSGALTAVYHFNAFSDLTTGLAHLAAGGTLCILGGSYSTAFTVGSSVGSIHILHDTDPGSAENTVTLTGAVTLGENTNVVLDNGYGTANLTFGTGGTIAGSSCSLSITTASGGTGSLQFDDALSVQSLAVGASGTALATTTLAAALSVASGNSAAIVSNAIAFASGGSITASSGTVTLNAGNAGQITAPASGTDVTAGTLGITAGAGVGSASNPLRFSVTNLDTDSSGDQGNQDLIAVSAATIDSTGLDAGTGAIDFDGGTFTLAGNNRINSNGAVKVNAGTLDLSTYGDTVAALTQTGGTLTGSGTLTVTGQTTWTGGTMSGSGTTSAQGGLRLGLTGDSSDTETLSARTLNNAGSGTWAGGGSFVQASGSTFDNLAGATFDIQNDLTWSSDAGSVFLNAGALTKSAGTGTTYLQPNFGNSGTVEVQSGWLVLRGGGTAGGSFIVDGGAGLGFQGGSFSFGAVSSITGAGTVEFGAGTATLAAGATYNVGATTVDGGSASFANSASTGALTLSSGSLTAAASFAVSGAAQISGGTASFGGTTAIGALTLSNGTLTGVGTVTVSGLTTWTGGTMSGSGTTIAQGGLQLGQASDASDNETLDNRTLDNSSSASWTGGGSFTQANGSTLVNQAGASFGIQNDLTWSSDSASVFSNAGTLTKTAGSGTTVIASVFNNTGTLDVESGTVSLSGGGSAGGTIIMGSAAALLYTNNFSANSEPDSMDFDNGVMDNVLVADFSAANPPGSYTATIDWGDGSSPSAGTISQNDDGSYSVYGSHTYSDSNDDIIQTTLSGVVGVPVRFRHFRFNGGPLSAYGTTPVFTEGQSDSRLLMYDFLDSDGNTNPNSYRGTIVWGDGKRSSVGLSSASGGMQITAAHTYAEEGHGTIDVQVFDNDGHSLMIYDPLIIQDAPLSASGIAVSATAGVQTTATVADFTDADPNGALADYSAMIDWGDGTTASTGTIASDGNGDFTVQGVHTYLHPGSDTVTVSIHDVGGSHATATSTATMARDGTTTTLTSAPNASYFGQAVTFTATVTANNSSVDTLTGSVTFMDGGTQIGTGSLAGGMASFSTPSLAVGSHDITAIYNGDANDLTSTSSSLTQEVEQDQTTTSLASSANPSVFGQSVTFTATVAVTAPGAGSPTGSVSFFVDGTAIGNGSLSGGTASISTSSLAVGAHSITATYNGDANDLTSTSSSLTQEVEQDQTTTSLASSANPSVFGQSVTFTATVAVTAPGAGSPTGSVSFFVDGTAIGNGSLSGGTASISTSSLAVGAHSITATYNGDANDQGSSAGALSQTVDKDATITNLTSAPNASVYGQSVAFTATVTAAYPGSGTPTGPVAFWDGQTLLGTAALDSTNDTAVYYSSALAVGSHTVFAVYAGDGNFLTSTSDNVYQTVNQAGTSTALSSSVNPSVCGQSVTFTATVTASAPGNGIPAGTVTFCDGATPLATTAVNSSAAATFTTSALGLGVHTITAVYNGSSSFLASSFHIYQTVNQAGSTTALRSSVNPSVFGQAVTFTATVAAQAPGTGLPTGTVTFYDGTTPLTMTTLDNNGIGTFTTSALAVGTHAIYAVYSGDANFVASSFRIYQTVNQAGTTTALVSSLNPSIYGLPVTFTATVSAQAPGSGVPTGTVIFCDGTTPLAATSLDSNGVAAFTTAALAVGTHAIYAVYGSDADFQPSSAYLSQIVNPNDTLQLVSSLDPSVLGQSVTFTASVGAVAPFSAVPTGSVAFSADGSPLGTETLDQNGVATLSTAGLTAGLHAITAVYSGDATFVGNAANLEQQVDNLVTVQANPFTAVAGVNTGPVEVATFHDTDTALSAGDFTAAIHWGDNSSPSAGTIVADSGGGFDVFARHTYASAGQYTFTVQVDDTVNAISGQGSATATVLDSLGLGALQPTADPQQGFLLPIGEAQVDLNQGAVQVSQPLDLAQSDAARNDLSFSLAYNSATAQPHVLVEAALGTDASLGVPQSIEATLTVAGQGRSSANFGTQNHQAGDTYLLALQVPVSGTDQYSWTMDFQVLYSGGTTVYESATGTADVVDRSQSSLGAGWGLNGLDQLVNTRDGSGDVLFVSGNGGARLFTANTNNVFTSPANDFGTLVRNTDGTCTYTAKDLTVYQFNALGLCTSQTEASGFAWNYQYDDLGRLTLVTGPDGGVSTFSYGSDGVLNGITEPGGRTLAFAGDSSGDLTHIVDTDGNVRTLAYGGSHLLTGDQWQPWNTTFSYTSGLLSGVALGSAESYSIASAASQGLATAPAADAALMGNADVVDGRGDITQYVLDMQDRELSETDKGSAANPLTPALVETWVYDGHGQLSQYTDAKGLTTEYTYVYGSYDSTLHGGDGDLLEVDNPDGSTLQYQYDPLYHETTQSIDGDGNVTVSTYDVYTGNLLSSTVAYGTSAAATTLYAWSGGLMTSMTDPDGNLTVYSYNSTLQLVGQQTYSATDVLVDDEAFTYDANGYQASQTTGATGPAPETTYTVYDGKGQLVSQTDPAGRTTLWTFDAYGDQVGTTDPRGITTVDNFDAADQETREVDDSDTSEPEATQDGYDAAGNMTSSVDPDGNTTVNLYDRDNRLIQTTTCDPSNNVISQWSYTYDADGNVLTSSDGDLNTTTDSYDAAGRVLSEIVTDRYGTVISSTSTTYDLDGNVLTSTDGDGNVTTNAYDAQGRLTSAVLKDRWQNLISSSQETYDRNGNVLQAMDGDGNVTASTYDGLGRLLSQTVTDRNGNPISSSSDAYDLAGNLISSTDGDGNVTTSTYDLAGNLLTQTVKDSTGNVISFAGYTYLWSWQPQSVEKVGVHASFFALAA